MYLMIINHHQTTPKGVKADNAEQLETMFQTMRAVFESSQFDIEMSEQQFVVKLLKVSKVALVTVRKVT